MSLSIVVSAILVLVNAYIARVLFNRNPAPLPPGPKGWPIVGNIADLPKEGGQDWLHWLQFKEKYGPISSITVMGQTLVILNDAKPAVGLFERRSAIHSSRPYLTFAGDMVGWAHGLALLPYSNRFRAYRKNMHRLLGSKVSASRFNSLQEVEVRRFLLRILRNPGDLLQHIRTEAGAVILKIAYGYTIEPHTNDPLVDLANDAVDKFSIAAKPGTWLVDIMPFLKHIPLWFPGAGFKRNAMKWRNQIFEVAEKPFVFVKDQMKQGTQTPSFLSALLDAGIPPANSEEEIVARWSAGSLYTGGADTTVSSIANFFMAMALYPDVQRKTQEEIDRVIGKDRLPTFDDQENLPYVNAVVKEVLRWHPVAPMGLPHTSTADDIYEGYFIPKGSIVMPNIWAFLHDPTIYHDPMTFTPERFLDSDAHTAEPDPHRMAFGFGRRECPGKLLADRTIFITVAQSLTVFNINKVVENGKEVDISPEVMPGVISHPVPYRVDIKPRSEVHEGLIKSVEVEHPWEKSHAPLLNINH
ncbi:cytochrome P450 [Aspergillus ellipticus CBS 707.79]|uniref:Cytochrome P450 n=1 Tax=Aspergillus ellipticus CBS 707.79 TaxID=1448320 RepID=A0A319CZ51_9EURO|nr:cytochrome P450 [Aspergillus ellipticus CBS 707.79]